MTALAGLRVLNPRPATQAAGLSAALRELGAEVVELPLLAMEPLPLSEAARQTLLNLDRYDFCFFVSSHAARAGLEAVAGLWAQWPHQLPVLAVGRATAEVLDDAGLTVRVPEQESSEGVLALPDLAEPQGLRVLVFRGEGGRELFADSLRARGATVDVVELYRRVLPPAARLEWAALQDQAPDWVLLTSPDVWANWQAVAGAAATRPGLVVVSERLAASVREAGAQRVLMAENAGTPALCASLLDWRISGQRDIDEQLNL